MTLNWKDKEAVTLASKARWSRESTYKLSCEFSLGRFTEELLMLEFQDVTFLSLLFQIRS
jgi:hypothetical protein